jgi:phosphopantetheinyl transferase (holo-ACP synthase)
LKSTGNDIVARRATNIQRQRANHTRFFSHILSVAEQNLFGSLPQSTLVFENFVWLAWSVKEGVFKYLKRFDADLVFQPTKIIVQNINYPEGNLIQKLEGDIWDGNAMLQKEFYHGMVVYNNQTLYFKAKLYDEMLISVVNDTDDFENVMWGFQRIESAKYSDQSRTVRELALSKFKSIFPDAELQITKSAVGYPVLLNNGVDSNIPLSFAHDGFFVGYSFWLDK